MYRVARAARVARVARVAPVTPMWQLAEENRLGDGAVQHMLAAVSGETLACLVRVPTENVRALPVCVPEPTSITRWSRRQQHTTVGRPALSEAEGAGWALRAVIHGFGWNPAFRRHRWLLHRARLPRPHHAPPCALLTRSETLQVWFDSDAGNPVCAYTVPAVGVPERDGH
jgi:hypothetical protein